MKDETFAPLLIGAPFIAGDVTFGEDCSVWPGASVRGDRSKITFGKGCNVQDSATVHSEAGFPVEIGDFVTIGHGAIVHGAKVENDVVIGMGAIVLDGVTIGEGCIIGAGAVIAGGKGGKVIPPRSVVVGNPYRILREASDEDVAANRENALEYVAAAKDYAAKDKK